MKITSADKQLFESATFIALGLGESRVEISQEQELLTFIFDFKTDTAAPKEKLEFKLVDENTMRIELTNWNNPLGTTINGPLDIGSFARRRLYLVFGVRKLGGAGELRQVNVNFYLGEEVRDGQT